MTYINHNGLYGYYPSQSHTHSIQPYPTMTWDEQRLMVDRLNQQLYNYPQTKEPEMSTLDKIKQQRKEERERGRIERMYDDYDNSQLAHVDHDSVWTFRWQPERSEKVYKYALLRTGEKWYLTGGSAPQGVDFEDLVAWLIEKNIEASEVTYIGRHQ